MASIQQLCRISVICGFFFDHTLRDWYPSILGWIIRFACMGPKYGCCIKVTLLTLLRILSLGRIGSIRYVLPIRQNIDILNRDIRVCTNTFKKQNGRKPCFTNEEQFWNKNPDRKSRWLGLLFLQLFVKGQLISKTYYLVLIWTKKPTKLNFDFCPSL